MSDQSRFTKPWRALALSAGLLLGSQLPALAAPQAPAPKLADRLAAVRQQLQQNPAASAETAQSSAPALLADWDNWNDWNDWHNWGNWNDWSNN